ncbi:hypothetical protein QMG83_06945 [Salinibacterium sp. G-O1]|uniref:hypothetical protein n=1 Tax=Salinibacterium sp. G-O1 TaxID=3046208 RepID=UPI0024BAF8B8|nr:hypothetical protein [Salinibacterium sp. G-O1]MDJ0334957.1 hypothetical protein [Salinibacterium sp. G-O1]
MMQRRVQPALGVVMPGERKAIDSPLLLDFRQFPVKPALFVVQQTREPTGIIERTTGGWTIVHTPWYKEINIPSANLDGLFVLYLVPYTDDTNLVLASIDQTFEPFFTYLSGADFGDELTKLVASQWPELYELLLHSNRPGSDHMMMIKTFMGGQVQWAVGRCSPAAQDEFLPKFVLDIIQAALEVFVRTSDVVALSEALPGLVYVLGGPQLGTRRLNSIAELLSSGAGLATGIAGGFQGNLNVVEAFLDARDVAKQVSNLVDDR